MFLKIQERNPNSRNEKKNYSEKLIKLEYASLTAIWKCALECFNKTNEKL